MNNLILNNIHVQFFKSIGSATIEIPELAVFVGKNAAGKSNIVSVFRFLRDLADKGFSTAIQQQGGRENLFNMLDIPDGQIEFNDRVILKIKFTIATPREISLQQLFTGVAFALEHSIIIQKELSGFSTLETFSIEGDFQSTNGKRIVFEGENKQLSEIDWNGEKILVSKNMEGNISYSIVPVPDCGIPSVPIQLLPSLNGSIFSDIEIGKKTLLDVEPTWGGMLQQFYSSIGIFDFIPKSIKSAVHTTGNATLDEDGGNINIILQHILQDEEKRSSFMNLVRYVLPFIHDVEIDIPRNGLAMPVIREAYSERFRLPAEFFSDGTATVIAIIVALFFEENSVVVIEEPERYVHPAIMDKLATLFEDAARSKKVVVTTHSPELIRHLKPEHVQLVSRDTHHFTQIRRVTDDEEIKSFLDSDMQLDDLLVNNFFED